MCLLIWVAFVTLSLASSASGQENQPTATPAGVSILSPAAGQALQGKISILANTAVGGFRSAELSFGYSHDQTETWFLIYESDTPVANGELTRWDTTTLTDGEYTLRLSVILEGGNRATFKAPGVRIRNYTPIETDTPTPVTPTATPEPGDTPLPTITPTPSVTPIPPTATLLPPNPAQISRQDIALNLGKGALAVVGLFALLGLYRIAHRIKNRE